MNISEPLGKHALGQHWLNDDDSLQAMLETAQITEKDTVLEIGPGLGSLTQLLVNRAAQVIAVELDDRLVQQLPKRVPAANLKIIQGDILHLNLNCLPAGYKVVANIPYYLTSNLLRKLCESQNHFSHAALLVQKEVAQRVTASTGAGSLLSVSVQFYAIPQLGRLVPARLFTPPPKVDSQILRLDYREKPLFPNVDTERFFAIVHAGFSQRRKTLANALSASLHLSKSQVAATLVQCGIMPMDRAQTLSLEDWYRLYKTIVVNT
ncbi:MAG TPA: 16S rRNA (adenine(1518)-N(6)/adenine(1519)-N(6))-dimethyltransferase RsmA [Candidatus Saccharimonadales bacterium]|nr:16S rRNA (adenine(1518)-N(6)/adenine(1519)-N(6))-dimethyltransferase RsmA [Candidatus Saccharimonadales bacterium]